MDTQDEKIPSIFSNNISFIKQYIVDKKDINVRDLEKSTPLMFHIMYNHEKAVQLLIEAGASVKARDNDGATALFYLSDRNSQKIIDLVIKASVNHLNVQQYNLHSPLDHAISYENLNVARKLVKFGATSALKKFKCDCYKCDPNSFKISFFH